MEIKDTYSKREVIKLLVANNNKIMKLIDNKQFKIVGDAVVTYRKGFFTDKEISRYTFDEILEEI